jgi:hypothetical protein
MAADLLFDRNLAQELREDDTLLRVYLGEHSSAAQRIRDYVDQAGVPYVEIPTHGAVPRAAYGAHRVLGPEAIERLIDELRRNR